MLHRNSVSPRGRLVPFLSLYPHFTSNILDVRNRKMVSSLLVSATYFLAGSAAQVPVLQAQNDTWNSTFQLSEAQIALANISHTVANNVNVALNYERTNNAGSLIQDDPFYQLPASYDHASPPHPGTVIKVEEYTNVALYTLPMSISMSRFLYMTETYNGTAVPASALVLWPYLPRRFPNLQSFSERSASGNSTIYPTLAWAHGSSGQGQACAPSGLRGLWDDFHEPFAFALDGYAVVAPDYAGLGVPNVTTNYFLHPAVANDLVFALEAAQKTWPRSLSKDFVVVGQSQGGATAWATAQRQAQRPVAGYLGTVAASPFTDNLADIAAESIGQTNVRIPGIARGIKSVFPDFQLSEWLTDAGLARLRVLEEIDGCSLTASQLGNDGVQIVKDDWNETAMAKWYGKAAMNGGKPFAGPM